MQCEELIENLTKEIGKRFQFKPTATGCVLITPFYDPSQDPIILQIKELDNGFEISDQTRTMEYLFLQGLDVKPNTKQDWFFTTIIDQYEIKNKNDELISFSNKEQLYEKILNFIEAIKSIEYLIYTSKTRIQSSPAWLDQALNEGRGGYEP